MMMEEGEKENSAAAAPAPVSNTIEVEAAGKEGRAAGALLPLAPLLPDLGTAASRASHPFPVPPSHPEPRSPSSTRWY